MIPTLQKSIPLTLFPKGSSGGDQTIIPHTLGTTINIAPLTPDFAGKPTCAVIILIQNVKHKLFTNKFRPVLLDITIWYLSLFFYTHFFCLCIQMLAIPVFIHFPVIIIFIIIVNYPYPPN